MAQSRFLSHVRLWAVVVPILATCLLPFYPDPSFFQISPDESNSVVDLLGVEQSNAIVATTNGTFTRLFIDTGLVDRTHNAVDLTDQSLIKTGFMDTFFANWVHNAWLMLYRILYRYEVLKNWAIGMIIFCVVLFNDGIARRKIRVSQSRTLSPISFHLSAHGFTLVSGIMATVLVIPIPIYASLWIWATLVLGLLCWKIAETYQSGRN